jgi:hypothetical protein
MTLAVLIAACWGFILGYAIRSLRQPRMLDTEATVLDNPIPMGVTVRALVEEVPGEHVGCGGAVLRLRNATRSVVRCNKCGATNPHTLVGAR